MIIYDLQCDQNHQFEGWFKSADDLTSQQASGMLTCPVCDSRQVVKKVTASKVTKKSNTSLGQSQAGSSPVQGAQNAAAPADVETYQRMQKMLSDVHQFVNENYTDVGNRFADEALKMHRGEKDAENIRGVASKEQIQELAEEGVSALPLPPKPNDKDKLN